MGKVYNNKTCCECGFEGQCIEVFGKFHCKKCYDSKPHKKGHSGMIHRPNIKSSDFVDPNLGMGLALKRVQKSHPLFVNWYLEHYPGSKGIMGRQINYLIYIFQRPVGIIGINSPPLNYKKFVKYFNISNYVKGESEKLFVNNNVFRIVIKPNDKNIGTKILKLFRQTIVIDYKNSYGEDLMGIITFVEPPRNGAIYKADNWDYLGMTEGVSVKRLGSLDDWTNKQYSTGVCKHIYAKHLR